MSVRLERITGGMQYMSGNTEPEAPDMARLTAAGTRVKASCRDPGGSVESAGQGPPPRRYELGWNKRLVGLLLSAVMISAGFGDNSANRIVLPIEILGADGTTAGTTSVLRAGQVALVHSLWLEIHGLRYADQASVQVNTSAWIPINNDTVTIAEPGKTFGGIGGGFSTLAITLSLPNGAVVRGTNTIRFRFNRTDGLVSGYRVLAWNFLTSEGKRILPTDDFQDDAPETWTPPFPDAASIRVGRELWHTALLRASSLPNSPRIQAHCADCHTQDGRDLKYFNFSNNSIVARARFHGLTTLQGEQIASYIRTLPFPNPGRPWNPPYQPGPGLDDQPVSNWAAGAGLTWVLDQDIAALPYLLRHHDGPMRSAALRPTGNLPSVGELVGQIDPDIFRPDGNLNARQIPVALQLPDWNRWLPHVHPKDAFGRAFTQSDFAALYGDETVPEAKSKTGTKRPLRALLPAVLSADHDIQPIVASFAQWSRARRAFLRHFVKTGTVWTPPLTDKVYSSQLWQLVKTWEMMQEFGLEERGHDLFGLAADSRTWCNTIPAEAAPAASHIPDGLAGVGGSELTNQYFTASWYELQLVLSGGSHQHRNRGPVDWLYVIGEFRDLYAQTHQPEPTRLLIAVVKALQSTNPHLGPDDLGQGWHPDENVDPRIMISPAWAPIFQPLPVEVRQALTASLLRAWMDKNLQYPVAQYLPLGLPPNDYTRVRKYGDITGGKVWEAAQQFRNSGVGAELVRSLQLWGMEFTDRAARLQYH
jgi:hypothetical protein